MKPSFGRDKNGLFFQDEQGKEFIARGVWSRLLQHLPRDKRRRAYELLLEQGVQGRDVETIKPKTSDRQTIVRHKRGQVDLPIIERTINQRFDKAVDIETYKNVWLIVQRISKRHGISTAELYGKRGESVYVSYEDGTNGDVFLESFITVLERDDVYRVFRAVMRDDFSPIQTEVAQALDAYLARFGFQIEDTSRDTYQSWRHYESNDAARQKLEFCLDFKPQNMVVYDDSLEELEQGFDSAHDKKAYVSHYIKTHFVVFDPIYLRWK